jgi:ATP-dependent protease ClpP protease subunit
MIIIRYLIILIALVLLTRFTFADTRIHLTPTNHVVLDEEFNFKTTKEVTTKFVKLINENQSSSSIIQKIPTLYLVIISNGGMVEPGLLMIDALNALPAKIHTIIIKGMSMGFITPQFLGKRYILPHGVLMTHKMRGGFPGLEMPGQMDSRYDFWLRRIFDINQHIVSRTKGILTIENYNELMENEYWCEGKNCIDMGFADEIVQLTCASELYSEVLSDAGFDFFGSKISVVTSKNRCPMVTSSQTVAVTIDGQPYDFKDIRINTFLKMIEESKNGIFKISK